MSTTTQNTIEFTRNQYLNKKCTHQQYYAQFVNDTIISQVRAVIGEDNIIAALTEGENLNTIPLSIWDKVAKNLYNVNPKMKLAGDYLTLSGGVCIAKSAARIIANKK